MSTTPKPTPTTASRRREAGLIIVASLLGLLVIGMYLSSRIAINLDSPKQLIVYMPTPRPKIIEQTNYVTVTKLITREVYISRPTEVPPPAAPEPEPEVIVAQAPAPAPEVVAEQPQVVAEAPPPSMAELAAAAPQVVEAAAPLPTAGPPPPPPPPWGDQQTFTTLSMGKEGYASWYDTAGTKYWVSLYVSDESLVGTLVAGATGGDVRLCVGGECGTNGGAFEASPFTVAGVTARYDGNGGWNIVANEGVLTRF